MQFRRSRLSAWLCVITAAATIRAADPPPVIDSIQSAMQTFVDDGQLSGAVTLVAHKGKVIHHGAVGLADIESKRPMTTDSLFWVASMTKPITATAVLTLQDSGKLNVDDPVSKYIPEFADQVLEVTKQRPGTTLTIRHLMTHTNGLVSPAWPDGGETRSLEEQAHDIASQPLKFEPGSKWQYGHGLTVAGRIVEIVSGLPFDEHVRRTITDPLGMHDTTFALSDEQRSRLVTVYKLNDNKSTLIPAKHKYVTPNPAVKITPAPSGGLFSSAGDMARFYQMILNGGQLHGDRIVSVNAVHKMTTIQSGDVVTGFTPGNGWGLGWCVVKEPQGVTELLSPGTFGHGGAYGTQGWVDPQREMILVLMIQRPDLGNSDGSTIREAFQEAAVGAISAGD
jgi:CubicO group peptidase (beta-lactamase class C family)